MTDRRMPERLSPRADRARTRVWAAAALVPLLAGVAILEVGCGVRGKPVPPQSPPEIGRGRPTFRRATEDLAFPQVAPVEPVPDPEYKGTSKPEDRP